MIYVSSPGKYDPPIGDYLGELMNELKKGEHSVQFVSGGPKNYAYKTNRENEMCKVRGFTLHVTNSQLINFESVKRMVLDPSETTITVTNPQKICRAKRKKNCIIEKKRKTIRWCTLNVDDSTITIQNLLGIKNYVYYDGFNDQ